MSKLLIQENPLTFQPSLAIAIGLNEAIVLQQVHYWINNPKNKGYEQDGFKWVYNTYAEWKETNFPFWSENTIQRTFSNLEEAGLIIAIQPMKGKYDRTKYYRINYDKLSTFDDTNLGSSDDTNLVRSLNESETTTETTTTASPLLQETIEEANAMVDAILESSAKQQETTTASRMFEKSFGFGALPWGSGGAWQKLLKFVTEIHSRDPQAFGKYVIWRGGEGKYAAMSNKQIRMNPQMFMDTGWAEFENGQPKKSAEPRPAQPLPDYTPNPRPANVPPPRIPKRTI
jgi:hypothetical protein